MSRLQPGRACVVLSGVLVLAACAAQRDGPTQPVGRTVTVDLLPVRGTTARGDVTLVQEARQVRVAARLSGLRPRWSYAVFLAERGDCGGSEAGGV